MSPAEPDSPDEVAARTRLAVVLASLFALPTDARRLVSDAGLDDVVARTVFEQGALYRWTTIMLDLREPARVDTLLAQALRERADSTDLVSAAQRWRARDAVDVAAGLTAPAAAATAHPQFTRPVLPPQPALVDRVDTMERLANLLSTVPDERLPRTVLLLGDSGVGKTRLANECIGRAGELGMAVIVAPCVDRHAEPLLPLRSAFAQLKSALPPGGLATGSSALGDYGPFLDSFLGGAAGAPMGGSSSQGVYDGLAQVLIRVAEPAGACLVVEDITDADRDTLSFLEYLAVRAAGSALVVVCTAKKDLLDDELLDRVDDWRVRGCTVEQVPPFAKDDAALFISVLRDGAGVDSSVVDEVFSLTGGNAFFIQQIVGLLDDDAEAPLAMADIPDRVEAVLARRLRRVPAATIEFLEGASVALDVTQQLDLVAHVCGLTRDEATPLVRQAVRDGHLRADDQLNLTFSQQLLQRALQEGMPAPRSTALNLRAAEWLEEAGLLASASHHYEVAGHVPDMVRTAFAAAEQAERSGLYATAAQLYQRLRQGGVQPTTDLRLARAYLVLGKWPEAEAVLDTLPVELGEARMLRSDLYFVRGSFDRALRELRHASQDPTVDRTQALIRRAHINLYLGNLHRAIELSEEALASTTDPTAQANCHAGIGTSLLHLGDLAGAEAAYQEELQALPADSEHRDRFAFTMSLHNLALAQEAHGNWARAAGLHAEALRVRQEVSAAREVGHSLHSILRCEVAMGHFERARELLVEARTAAVALGEELEQAKLDHTEGQLILRTGGDPAAAVRLIASAREHFRDLCVAYDVAHASFTLSQAYTAAGATRRAIEEAAAARAMMQRGDFGLLAHRFPDIAFTYAGRVEAGLLAFAAGDAVGLPWERMPAIEIDEGKLPLLEATSEWPAGATSDDTALTILVSEHLTAEGPSDGSSFLHRLAEAEPWIRGLGPSTTAAIDCYRRTGAPPSSGGTTNGALMRSLPVGWSVPIDRVDERRALATSLSRATHTGSEAVAASWVGAACAAWAIEGASPALLVEIARDEAVAAVEALDADPRLVSMLDAVVDGAWQPDYTVDQMDPFETVCRVLANVLPVRPVRESVLAAVRLGGDTDTVAALVGGILGCRLPVPAVRSELTWLDEVHLPRQEDLSRLAAGLAGLRVRETDG